MDTRASYESAMRALLARCRSDAVSRFVDLKRVGIRAHVLVEGEGPPLVLIHGGGGNASNWAPILSALAKKHTVYAVDRPGCGLTDAFDPRRVDLLEHGADFVADVMDALDLPRASLVGNSMGGLFAASFAAREPARVEKLVLVGSPAGAARATPVPLRIMGTCGLNRLFFATVGRPSAAQMRRTLRMLLVAHPERVTGEMIEAMWRGAAMPHAREGWRRLLESCNGLTGFHERYLLAPLLPRIRAPTLWLWGARDGYAPTATGRALAGSMKDATFVEVPEAGHLAWLDQPVAIREAIESFVAPLRPATRIA